MNRLKTVLTVAILMMSAGLSSAQTPKFGHINMQTLIDLMPERDSAYIQLTEYGKSLEETMVGMQNEYQAKLDEYNQKRNTWSQLILESKTQELRDIENRIYSFQQTAQTDMQQMQSRLFAPVLEKARAAVDKVGKSLALVYVFDTTTGVLTYIDSEQSIDLLPQAKAELGIPAEKVAPTQLSE